MFCEYISLLRGCDPYINTIPASSGFTTGLGFLRNTVFFRHQTLKESNPFIASSHAGKNLLTATEILVSGLESFDSFHRGAGLTNVI